MPLTVNLRHLEAHNVALQGELPIAELDIDSRDEVIRLGGPLRYDLEAQRLGDALLIQGRLSLTLACQCVRCLKGFDHVLDVADWTCLLPLQGEEAVRVANDCVDLTPYLREDILLAFPQHPLCNADCRGLPKNGFGQARNTSSTGPEEKGLSAWDELDKLKL